MSSGLEDIDTAEFLAVHHPDIPVKGLRQWSSRLRSLKSDPENTGRNIEFIFRFMEGWKLKFLDFRGRDTCTAE